MCNSDFNPFPSAPSDTVAMDNHPTSKVAISHVTSHPSPEFFTAEIPVSATTFVGCYTHGRDYQLALIRTPLEGNSFVYKARGNIKSTPSAGAKCHHVFLLGAVIDLASLVAIQSKASQIPHATNKANRLFARDFAALEGIMVDEKDESTAISSTWCKRLTVENGSTVDQIQLDCSPLAEICSGPLGLGCILLIDATMHMQDVYREGVLSKLYTLVAHKINVIEESDAADVGIVDNVNGITDNLGKMLNIRE
ncbi:hypothetical protein C8F04DRAFT_1255122 [Mycena alexandri]|uniref:Uncharacterized protein n=1 Tax=Mycena alexandri TaxID=1745969 RepID=A0AAD6T445_9AGAR|nr:hypothetical protein C8F04DRAFT_1255122 [Mycena alexandri]